MHNFRRDFPALEHQTYLNTASCGLLSESVWKFRQDHDLEFLTSGGLLKEKTGDLLKKTREAIGTFFTCAPNRVALVPNFSIGFNSVLEAMERKQKVLLLKEDYPSITWAVESRGFALTYVTIDTQLEENILRAFKEQKPDIFAFSIVQYLNGIRLGTEFLRALKNAYPDTFFIADGTQFLGTEIFDFEATGLDLVICSGYKWLNAGFGNGLMLVKEGIQDRFDPEKLRLGTFQSSKRIPENQLIHVFERGHLDSLSFGSLLEAVRLLSRTGMKKVEGQLKELKQEAKAVFLELGFLEESVINRKEHAPIFNLKGDDRLYRYLRGKGLIVSRRGSGVRVSFHYFNTREELALLVGALKEYRWSS